MRFTSVKAFVEFIVMLGDVAGLCPLSSIEELIKRIRKYPRHICDLKVGIDNMLNEENRVVIIVENPDIFAYDNLIDEISLFRVNKER